MSLIRFSAVGKQYGDRWIFRDVSFQISAGERWGVVGRNGEGKTTLFRVLDGTEPPDQGEVWRHPGVRLTVLQQERGEQSSQTIAEAALEPFAELVRMEQRIQADSERLSQIDASSPEAGRLLASYDRQIEEFRRRGGYEMRARAEATLEGLGFPPETWSKPIRLLSGGELGRLRLAQTLLAEPEVLLLDEPTNHLDLRSTEWLEEYLSGYRGTVVVISHDRVFLEHLCDHILHLEEGTAFAYTGGFQSFLEQREERRGLQRRQYEQQQALIARTEDFIRRNIAGQKTKQAKSRRKLLERMDRVASISDDGRAMALRFAAGARSGGTVLRVDGVQSAFGQRVLFAPFSAEVSRGERIAIVGPNGCGKSTLMRALAGVAAPQEGRVVAGAGVRTAYYRQDFTHLDPKLKIREAVEEGAPALPFQELRGHLARFLFSGDAVEARVGDLSGGEQARVALARITLQRANLLLLDEPTNHLDIESREVLEEALEEYDGTVILISHDRAFLSALATRVWGFVDGSPPRIEDYPGGFDDWLAHRAERAAAAAAPRAAAAARAERPVERPSSAGLSKNELRRREQEMQRLEERIARAEGSLAETERELADPALYTVGDAERIRALTERRDATLAELEELYAAWERVGAEIEAV